MKPAELKESLQDELLWIEVDKYNGKDKFKNKEWSLYLVPLGCLSTVGVLATGLYHMSKRNSLKQQLCMRLRILSQGVTLAVAMLAMFNVGKETKKS